MAERKKQTRPRRAAEVLPPIPTDTPEGIRALAIRDTIAAVDQKLPGCQYGLQLQDDALAVVARDLGVPVLHVVSSLNVDHNTGVEEIDAYVAWRQQLAAGKAVR